MGETANGGNGEENIKTDDEKQNDDRTGRLGTTAKKPIRHFRDLDVYQNALEAGLRVYELSKKFPDEERYALIDQIRRSSRSVCANIAEAWRKRRYTAAFISKLTDSEGEAAETQVHIEFAFRHGYISNAEFEPIDDTYEHILGQLVRMIDHPEKWVIGRRKTT
jgi:four helix bundle protein